MPAASAELAIRKMGALVCMWVWGLSGSHSERRSSSCEGATMLPSLQPRRPRGAAAGAYGDQLGAVAGQIEAELRLTQVE